MIITSCGRTCWVPRRYRGRDTSLSVGGREAVWRVGKRRMALKGNSYWQERHLAQCQMSKDYLSLAHLPSPVSTVFSPLQVTPDPRGAR